MLHGHTHVVLWFSGGKDSLACLYLLRDQLDDITVLWVDTGKNYPEAMQVIDAAKHMCPRWETLPVDRDAQWAQAGMPADLVPTDATVLGQALSRIKPTTVQSQHECCWANIGATLCAATARLGATLVISGQRADEAHHSTSTNGSRVQGFQFWYPLEAWTRAEVLDYLTKHIGTLPAHYALDHTSLDCYDCTGFADSSHDRVAWMRDRHPLLFQDYREKLTQVHTAIQVPLSHYQTLMEAVR